MAEQVLTAVPFPRVGLPGVTHMWGVVCPAHPQWGAPPEPTDADRCCAEVFAAACACGHPAHLGTNEYPVGDGRAFIGNRWVLVGRQGYRVVPQEEGTWSVVWFAHTTTRPVYGGQHLTHDDAHVLAHRLAYSRH